MYADFESFIKPCDIRKGKSTYVFAKQEINAIGAILLSKFEKYNKKICVNMGKHPVKKFIEYLNEIKKETHTLDEDTVPVPHAQ